MIKKQRGITLVALVVTMIILIILSTVTIEAVLGDNGLIEQAQKSKEEATNSINKEDEELNDIEQEYANMMEEDKEIPIVPEKSEVEEAIENGTKYESTTPIKDKYENTVYVPGGFKLATDSGTTVAEGIVIEDAGGNQFVWIPVGTYKISESKSETNNLSRRTFTSTGATEASGVDTVISTYYYAEDTTKYTTVAKDTIGAFKTSATTNSGFYIGRYEAGTETERTSASDPVTTPFVQANKNAYVYVTRDQAKAQAEAMYSSNTEIKGTTQLISSYAWDTALNFICQTNEEGYMLATTNDKAYGNIGTENKTQTGQYKVDEVESDKYSNIYDLLGNCFEWSTEYTTYDNYNWPCVIRGGYYGDTVSYGASRFVGTTNISNERFSFRLQLYV